MEQRIWRRTTCLCWILGGFLIGLAVGRRYQPQWWLVIVGSFLLWRGRRWTGLVVLILLLGWWRGAGFRQQIRAYEPLYGQAVTVRVTARTGGYYHNGNLAFDAGKIHAPQPLPGVLAIEAIGIPAVFRGDQLELTGKLYPTRGAKQGSIKFAQGRVVQRQLSWLERLRLRFAASLQTVLPEPQAAFGLGLLVGQRTSLPAAVGEQLSAVGLTHIIAVSGYNLTVIVRYAGKRLGRSKYQTWILSISLILMFVLITGFSASIVRATIVNMLSLNAWYYGRELKPLLIILLAATITAGHFPVYLWSDIGWYLSFLAFFGVLILAPLLTKQLWGGREPGGIMPLILESACAQVMAAPLIMYIFGETSLIALPANMVIVPLVPLAMLLTAAGGVAGMILPGLGAWLAWPARLLLGYMLQMVDWLSRTPHALAQTALPWPGLIATYTVIAWLCWRLSVKIRLDHVKITDKGD